MKIKRLLALLLLFITLTSCSAQGDWTVALCDGYKIMHVNTQSIVLVKTDSDGVTSEVYSSGVKAFKYSDAAFALKLEMKENGDADGIMYVLYDGASQSFSEAFQTESELDGYIEKTGAAGLSEWIDTRPTPSMAKYN